MSEYIAPGMGYFISEGFLYEQEKYEISQKEKDIFVKLCIKKPIPFYKKGKVHHWTGGGYVPNWK